MGGSSRGFGMEGSLVLYPSHDPAAADSRPILEPNMVRLRPGHQSTLVLVFALLSRSGTGVDDSEQPRSRHVPWGNQED